MKGPMWPGEVVADNHEQFQPAQQAMGTEPAPEQPTQSPEQGAAEAFPGEVVPDQQPADQPTRVESSADLVGQFGDAEPTEASAKMSPEQEAEYTRILSDEPMDQAGDKARRYLASLGFDPGPSSDSHYADSIDQILDYRAKHGVVSGDVTYPLQSTGPSDGTAGSFARGMVDTPTMGFMDELYGVAQALQNPSGHGFNHDMASFTDQWRGKVDRDEKDHPIARVVGQLFGGLGIPLSYEGVGFDAGSTAMREARAGGAAWSEALQAGRSQAARAVRNAMIRDGAYVGGAHGVGSGEGVGGRLTEGLTEAGIGAAGGAATGAIGEVVAPRMAAARQVARAAPAGEAQQVRAAAERQGVDLLPADTGGPVTRRATSVVAQTIGGVRPIVAASQRMTDQSQGARDRIAGTLGRAMEPEAYGQEAIRGARGFITRTSAEGNRLYRQAEGLAGDTHVTPTNALRVLDENIAELGETPGGTNGLTHLQGLRDVLARSGGVSVRGMRGMRTTLRDEFAENGLRGSDLERRVNQVIDAANEDVTNGLRSAGRPEAAQAYGVADRYWRNRLRTIDSVVEPIVGNIRDPAKAKSGEEVAKALNGALQGNNQRAVAFLRTLGPGEAGDVRASIIGALGRVGAGRQGAEGTDFSLNDFLTHWNKIGETAKRAYFGAEGRAALNDLARIAESTKEAQRYRNFSNTGSVGAGIATLASGLGGFPMLVKVVGTQYAAGRLLASPRFARWLARAPRSTLSREAYVERLGRIAKAEPAIAGDILSLQQRLTDAFKVQPMRAAASDNQDKSERR